MEAWGDKARYRPSREVGFGTGPSIDPILQVLVKDQKKKQTSESRDGGSVGRPLYLASSSPIIAVF